MKKFILALIIIIYTFASCLSSVAAPENEKAKTSASENEKDKEEKPKESGKDKNYTPHADYMLLCDVESGFKIYSKGSGKTINPYGLTKILTAITVIENQKNLTKEITVPQNILKDYDYSYGNIGLMSGERISVKNLLYALIMQDAGDCAIALAHSTGKSYKEFIEKMNETAKKAGAKSSVFTEPAGFNTSKQKTTLEDMAKITSYALKNQTFAEIAKTQRHEIPSNNKCNYARVFFSKNYFLTRFYSEDYFDTRVSGVKGYYKDDSDTGLIVRYTKGNDDLLVLTARSERIDGTNYAYEDTLHLLEKGNDYFTKVRLIKKEEFVSELELRNAKGTSRALIVAMNDIVAKLPKEYKEKLITREIKLRDHIDAPLNKFEELGKLYIYYDGMEVGSSTLASYSEIEKSNLKIIKNTFVDFLKKPLLWIIIAIVWLISYIKNKKNKKL